MCDMIDYEKQDVRSAEAIISFLLSREETDRRIDISLDWKKENDNTNSFPGITPQNKLLWANLGIIRPVNHKILVSQKN